jgi:methionyl-tRNA synthetase
LGHSSPSALAPHGGGKRETGQGEIHDPAEPGNSSLLPHSGLDTIISPGADRNRLTRRHEVSTGAGTMADTPGIIEFAEFAKLDMRTAKVLEVRDHPNADKLICMKVDVGSLGERQIVAGLKPYLEDPQSLTGQTIIIAANLAPRTMRGETSQGMLLAASSEDRTRVITLTTSAAIEPGCKIS